MPARIEQALLIRHYLDYEDQKSMAEKIARILMHSDWKPGEGSDLTEFDASGSSRFNDSLWWTLEADDDKPPRFSAAAIEEFLASVEHAVANKQVFITIDPGKHGISRIGVAYRSSLRTWKIVFRMRRF